MAQIKRTRQRGLLFLIVGVFFALLTAVLVLGYMAEKDAEIGDKVAILRVKRDIPADTVLSASVLSGGAFEVEEIPIKWAPSAVFQVPPEFVGISLATKSANDMRRLSDVVDRVTLVRLRPGDVLQSNYLHSYAGLEPGFRAVTISVNAETGVGGVVRGGNVVDVIASWEDKAADGKITPQTRLFLQNVRVLAVGSLSDLALDSGVYPDAAQDPAASQAMTTSASSARFLPTGEMVRDTVVTLALKPEDAVKLTYMVNFAKEVRLMFRRPGEQGLAPDILIGPGNIK